MNPLSLLTSNPSGSSGNNSLLNIQTEIREKKERESEESFRENANWMSNNKWEEQVREFFEKAN